MISFIWVFWILNQIIVQMIMMNILIAIIVQCYDEIMANETNYFY